MISNEQKAHDLAIATISNELLYKEFSKRFKMVSTSATDTVPGFYNFLYSLFLDSFKHDS